MRGLYERCGISVRPSKRVRVIGRNTSVGGLAISSDDPESAGELKPEQLVPAVRKAYDRRPCACTSTLKEKQAEIAKVIYCSTLIDPTISNPEGPKRQKIFIKALRASGAVEHVEYGRYISKVKRRPLAKRDMNLALSAPPGFRAHPAGAVRGPIGTSSWPRCGTACSARTPSARSRPPPESHVEATLVSASSSPSRNSEAPVAHSGSLSLSETGEPPPEPQPESTSTTSANASGRIAPQTLARGYVNVKRRVDRRQATPSSASRRRRRPAARRRTAPSPLRIVRRCEEPRPRPAGVAAGIVAGSTSVRTPVGRQ